MKKVILYAVLFSFSFILRSQDIPSLKTPHKELSLFKLDIQVSVVGNMATTTYDMLFYNSTHTILEGEFLFPLGEGHDVSRFALDINGKLREAVVVEKELGRIAFEGVVRKGVDPALLEKGTGNNYKARIYPIPANGYKRVVLAYEQEILYADGSHYYHLPLDFKEEIDDFKVKITVFDQESKPVVKKSISNGLQFSKWQRNFTTQVSKKNFVPNESITLAIPIAMEEEKIIASKNYFYAYKILNEKERLRKKPKSITIYWDASLSMENRNLDKEKAFLELYFSYLQDVTVDFISFSNTILNKKRYQITDGDWTSIRNEIEEVVYDGGTSFLGISQNLVKVEAFLLFSDGITTLSKSNFVKGAPIFTINSIVKSDHESLKTMAETTNGSYLNLNTISASKAMSIVKKEPLKYLGYTTTAKDMEIYPATPIQVAHDFSVSGKGYKPNDIIVLQFGYGNNITREITITVPKAVAKNKNVRRIWAQKKLDGLRTDTKSNKIQITGIGKEYGIVTDYTSLIVLDDVADYVAYDIPPPEELREAYDLLKAENKSYDQRTIRVEDIGNEVEMAQGFMQIVEDEEMGEMTSAFYYSAPNNTESMEIEEEIIEVESSLELNDSAYDIVPDSTSIDVPFTIVEKAPLFPGCQGNNQERKVCFNQKLNAHIREHYNMRLLENLEDGQASDMNVRFTINEKGKVANIRSRGGTRALKLEMKRVLNLLPPMIPGIQRGKNVAVPYTFPFRFNTNNEPRTKRYKGDLKVRERSINTQYIQELKSIKKPEKAYAFYLKQREEYKEVPAYFIDVSNYFRQHYKHELFADRIVSNIAEVDFDNYELIKVYAYQSQLDGENDLAVFLFERIVELRSEDIQSYRDLALAYQKIGKCQEALDLFLSISTGELNKGNQRRNFKGINSIVENEIKHLIKKYKDDLNLSAVDKKLLNEPEFDIRIVVDWNHNDTDIDLHVIDPKLEECFYSHRKTAIGGTLSHDMTQGFGPEEFTLKNALKGEYYVKIKYYGDRYQKIENPTFMKVTLYKYYGAKRESKEIKMIRLTKKDDYEVIAKLVF